MSVTTDKKTLSQAIDRIRKADTAKELQPILEIVLATIANAQSDDAEKAIVAHVVQCMHQAHGKIRKAEQKNSATALATAMKQFDEINKALTNAERIVELRDQRIHELELQLNQQSAMPQVEASPRTYCQEQQALPIYQSATSTQQMENVGKPDTIIQVPVSNVAGLPDQLTGGQEAQSPNIRQTRAPPPELFYGYHDNNQRAISKPHWQAWHTLFEMHYRTLPE